METCKFNASFMIPVLFFIFMIGADRTAAMPVINSVCGQNLVGDEEKIKNIANDLQVFEWHLNNDLRLDQLRLFVFTLGAEAFIPKQLEQPNITTQLIALGKKSGRLSLFINQFDTLCAARGLRPFVYTDALSEVDEMMVKYPQRFNRPPLDRMSSIFARMSLVRTGTDQIADTVFRLYDVLKAMRRPGVPVVLQLQNFLKQLGIRDEFLPDRSKTTVDQVVEIISMILQNDAKNRMMRLNALMETFERGLAALPTRR